MSRTKHVLLWMLSAFYVAAGIAHFVMPAFYLALMPPQLPYPEVLVVVSGVIEIALGIAVLAPDLRKWAAWGLVALLIAVFPANVYAAVAGVEGGGGYFRLPFQALFIAWAWWFTKPDGA
jgi:uncharacterized membrane protein